MVGCYVIDFGCWWWPWGEVGRIIGTTGSGKNHLRVTKMASQLIIWLIKTTPQLKTAVDPIGTRPMEAGKDVLLAVVTIKLTIEVKNGT